MSNDDILMNVWEKLKYHDPITILSKFREIEPFFIKHASNDKVRNLRTQSLKTHREGREAALFCHGLSVMRGDKVYFARYEKDDYDIVTLRGEGEYRTYTPVQLKELVPDDVNSKASFQKEVEKLKKYVTSHRLVVAMQLNRTGKLDVASIQLPKLNISELWVYGAETPDQSKWFLIGDLLSSPSYTSFSYPE